LLETAFAPAIQVEIQDDRGNTIAGATDSVTLAFGANPSDGTLRGVTTVAAMDGVATFDALYVDHLGSGFTLTATAGGLTPVTSGGFDIHGFASVTAGSGVTCGLLTDGTAWCWGRNQFGEVGDGTLIFRGTPIAVVGGHRFTSLSAGGSHACGLTASGAAYCWGTNFYGQLGNGADSNSREPAPVAGGLAFTAVSAGMGYTCALTAAGSAYCWGRNSWAQLGNGSTANSNTPVAVAGGLTFRTVSTGSLVTCGVTTGNAAWCWGLDTEGELGDGPTAEPDQCDGMICSTTPVAVVGGLAFATVSAGSDHACGLTTGGAVHCWGSDTFGELGDSVTPVNYPCSIACSLTPVPLAGGLTFAAVSAGFSFSCGQTTGGATYCWGSNAYGQLGNRSSDIQRDAPVGVVGASGLGFTAVSAGFGHACAVTSGGKAYCWGNNDDGTLGTGSTAPANFPRPVSFP
jgi:alpha-tubulin suppressor-like RCC1 family protein